MAEQGANRLFLVRHGEVAANRTYAFIGRRDDALTEMGHHQAKALADLFGNLSVDGVLTSPLRRARDTGRRIAAAAGCGLELDDRLIEQSFGRWDGLTRGQVADLSASDRESLAVWERDPTVPPPGGESLLSVQRRVVALVAELAEQPGRSLVVVSHVGPIKTLICKVLGVSLADVKRLFLDPGSISVVDWRPSPVLRLFNSHAHLGWTRARWLESQVEVDESRTDRQSEGTMR